MPLKCKILAHPIQPPTQNFYLSDAPHALPQADGFSSGLSPAPHAVPQAAGFSSGLSPAPHAVPQAVGASYVFLFHPYKFESAIIKSSYFPY
jgi:hypothetical protein